MTHHAEGMKTRRKVLGETYVSKTEANRSDFDGPFQDLITEAAWGHVWSRGHITLRERSMITLALLAAQGQDEEVMMHARACRNTGATADDMREVLLHVAIYAGAPAANRAFRIVKEVLTEMDGKK